MNRLGDHATDRVHEDFAGLAFSWYLANLNRMNDVFDELSQQTGCQMRITEARLHRQALYLELEVSHVAHY